MDHIHELKALRDGALSRLQQNPDYRTLRSLTALIDELTLLGANTAAKPLPASIAAPSADIGPLLKAEDLAGAVKDDVDAKESTVEKAEESLPPKINGRVTNFSTGGAKAQAGG